jgi:phospholipid/cholesterol/gamma-HCH transport system permease protein
VTRDLFHAANRLERLGHRTLQTMRYVGGTTRLLVQVLWRGIQPPLGLAAFAEQAEQSGMRSLLLTLVMALFAGMVLAFQFGAGLIRFGAKQYLGQVTAIAVVKEIIPVLVALVVGGRIAAGIAAELGSMAVTEQIDAVRAIGADPIKALAAPRVLATTMVLPLVTVAGDVIATLGAMVVSRVQYGVRMGFFFTSTITFLLVGDFLSGVIKATVFGLIVSSIACYEGFMATAGTAGVGRATTRAFIFGAIASIVSDYFLTKFLWIVRVGV